MTNHREFFSTEMDAARLTRNGWLAYTGIYVEIAVCWLGWLPGWVMLISMPIFVVRWMLATHELFHLRDERGVDSLTRLMPLLLTPLSLGYPEFLRIHREHHVSMATPQDPEYFQIRGPWWQGMFNAMTAPEQHFWRWIVKHPADRDLYWGAAIRLSLIGAFAIMAGPVFWWYWVSVRMAFGLSYFSFFYLQHRRGDTYGVYRTYLPDWVRYVFSVLFGREAMLATCYHDIHHQYPRVSAFHLPILARMLGKGDAAQVS